MQFQLSGGFANFQLINIGELKGQGVELKSDWLTLDRENLSVATFVAGSYFKEETMSMVAAPPIKLGGTSCPIRLGWYPSQPPLLPWPQQFLEVGTLMQRFEVNISAEPNTMSNALAECIL